MADFDLLIIGGGWGGYSAAQTFAQGGRRVALVEADKIGGVCLHSGCIPTKALLETAAALRIISAAADRGVTVTEPRLRWRDALANRDAVVDRLHAGMQGALEALKVEWEQGQARMTGPTSVEVKDGRRKPVTITADSLIIATGSAAAALPFLPIDGKRVVTSDQALSIAPPRRALIVGAGAVGMEFASLWCDLGAEVTLLELAPQVLPQEDTDTARVAADSLRERGVQIETGAQIDPDSVSVTAHAVVLEYTVAGEIRRARADVLLVATGRRPRFGDLAPDVVGVDVSDGAIRVDAEMRTSVEHVYAVGDVTGGMQLAHVAAAQGRFVAQWLLGQTPPVPNPVWMPRAVYCTPQVASVGLTEAQARATGRAVRVGRAHFSANGRALIRGDATGMVKLIGDSERGDLLGAHIVGPEASELIGQLSLAGFLETSVWELATAVQPHPTLSEAVAEAAQALLRPRLRAGA